MTKYPSFHLSFEFFPPKTEEGKENLRKTAIELAATEPDFFSVTFGAGGSTQTGTIDVVNTIHHQTKIPVAPHLTCTGASRTEIIEILQQYKLLGVRRIIALRGDHPSGKEESGELRFANELIELIRDTTQSHFHLSIAAYPEFHPQAECALKDMHHFKNKVSAGADSAITQYFFNPEAYFYFLDHCAKLGISIPVTPGIMPITNFSKLVRFSDMCGAEIPRWIRKRLEAYGDDQASIQAFGTEVVYDLCQRLIAGGAPGLHFYTLNQSEASLALLKLLNLEKASASPQKPRVTQEPDNQ